MIIYIWIIFVVINLLNLIRLIWSSETEERIASFIAILIMLPVWGRALGWW